MYTHTHILYGYDRFETITMSVNSQIKTYNLIFKFFKPQPNYTTKKPNQIKLSIWIGLDRI